MLLSSEEAKKKDCPLSYSVAQGVSMYPSKCCGDACMLWVHMYREVTGEPELVSELEFNVRADKYPYEAGGRCGLCR